jgi:Spy/CpxP family protein refolding chaperone
MIEPETQVRPLPAWLMILVIVLCLGGGGYAVWRYIAEPPATTPVPVDNVPGRAANRPRAAQVQESRRAEPPTVQTVAENRFRIRAGESTLDVNTSSGKPVLSFRYSPPPYADNEHRLLRIARWRITRDNAVAKDLKITDEQMAALNKIGGDVGMVVSDADHNRMTELWLKYQAAPDNEKPAATRAIQAALTEIGSKAKGATQKALQEYAEKIKAVLTAEQFETFKAKYAG